MAEKTHSIQTPGGPIEVPAWASEETMNRVVAYASAQSKTDAKFTKLIKKAGGNINELAHEISELIEATQVDNKQDERSEKKQLDISKSISGFGEKLNGTMRFFEQTDKPLTAMVDGVSALVKGTKKTLGKMNLFEGLNPTLLSALKTSANVGIDAALAYAGWNAGKLEQFAKAQAGIIDAGVVFSNGAEGFDELRKQTISTGNTYTSLIENVHQFGEGMLGLGSNMAEGVQNFSKFYGALDKAAEGLGDLGLSSKDMQSQYAEYIAFARRTGIINKDINSSANDVNSEFINLQIEAGAIANMTSLTRAEAMRRQLGAFNDYGDAAVKTMRDLGLIGHAEASSAIVKNLGLMAPDSTMISKLLEATQIEMAANAKNPEKIDISTMLQKIAPGMETALDSSMPGLVKGIENILQSGTATNDDVRNFLFKMIKNAETTADQYSITSSGEVNRLMLSNATELVLLQRKMGNLADGEDYKAEVKNQLKTLKDAGKITKEMNNMTRRFLEIQETLTLDMATTSAMFNKLTGGFEAESKKLLELTMLDQEVNDFGGIGGDLLSHATAYKGEMVASTNYEEKEQVVNEGDSKQVVAAKTEYNEGMAEVTEADFEGFTQIRNIKNAVAQLNSVNPQYRKRLLQFLKDFEEEYKGTDKKVQVSKGMIEKLNENDPDTYENSGIAASLMFIDGDDIQGGDGKFNGRDDKKLVKMAAKHGLVFGDGKNGSGKSTPYMKEYSQKNDGGIFGREFDEVIGNLAEAKEQGIGEFKDGVVVKTDPPKMKNGGRANAGQPYIVGDQLGMNTAELFVPDQSGTIVSNKDLKENAKSNNVNSIIEQMQQQLQESESYIGRSVSLTFEQMYQRIQEIQNTNVDSDASSSLAFKQMQQRLQELENTNAESDASSSLTYEQMQQRLQELGNKVKATATEDLSITDTFQDLQLQIQQLQINDENSVGPSMYSALTSAIKDVGLNLTKTQDPAIMNKATDLSGLLDSKKQVIASLKSLQSIIKRLNNNNNLNIDIDMMNSR